MTQLSPFTSIFDKVAVGISSIVDKKNQGKYVFKEEIISDFNKILNDAYRNIDTLNTSIDLISQDEPPSSSKMNKFFSDLKNDINISSKQLDYLLAKTISVFNLFSSQIENEKKYSNRVFSKLKILQMYSQSPSQDIVYIGDSFDNQDFLDFSRIEQNSNPLIESGSMGLQINSSRQWVYDSIKLNQSNGIPGNNFQCIKKNNEVSQEQYVYSFMDKSSYSNIANITDSNPLTIFDYEILNVERQFNTDYSENEFSYIVDSEIIKNASSGSLFNWSDHSMLEPLVLDFSIFSSNGSLANYIKITPYFGSAKMVKVKELLVTDKEGVTRNVMSKPIYIGSSFGSISLDDNSSYFLQSATIRFKETNAMEVRVIMEQSDYELIEILHSYWATNYSGIEDNSPFFGSTKFSPDFIGKDIYEEISYSKDEIIPPISNPNIFSKQENLSKNISVSLKKKSTLSSGESIENYTVPLKMERQLLKAKRMNIGIRDILVQHVTTSNTAEIVSLPYLFDKPVEAIMLSVESDVGISSKTRELIKCYISVDDGKKWYDINPTQSGFNYDSSTLKVIPEILVFNQNTPSGYKLPGTKYYNAPEIPETITKILIKINIQKDTVSNMSPQVYGYTLVAKVKLQ